MTEVFQRTYARVSVRERTERSASRASNEPENGRAVRRLQAEVLLISAAVFVVDADRTGSSAVTGGVPGGAYVVRSDWDASSERACQRRARWPEGGRIAAPRMIQDLVRTGPEQKTVGRTS